MINVPLILVVDDVPTNVKILEIMLLREGFRVITAASGAQAKALAADKLPDLILLDIMMPDESGFEVCKALKQNPVTCDIPILFISALGDTESKVNALSLGGTDYVTKPFEKAEILLRIRIQLKVREAYRALVEQQKQKMDRLREAQKSILIQPEALPSAQFGIYYRAYEEAGGDFYDVFEVGQDIFGYLVADVSGHGVQVGFVTSALKALFRQNIGAAYTLEESMKMVNSVIRTVLSEDQHVTAIYAQLNRKQGTLRVINAGHPPLLILGTHGEPRYGGSEGGDPLGIMEPATFGVEEIKVVKGERFYLFTDGILEIKVGDKNLTREKTLERFVEAAKAGASLDIKAAPEVVLKELRRDQDPNDNQDDQLLLGVGV